MRPDPEYIKRILTTFEDAPDPTININDLKNVGLSYETPEFYFHLRLLNDQDFVRRDDDQPGIGADGSDGNYMWSVLALRLTASGHEFAGALNNSKAFEKAKSVATFGLAIMRDMAVAVAKVEVMKHLGG